MNTHRWERAVTTDDRWGLLCKCGNLKTDQALTCTDCAIERRRAPDYWQRRTCPSCGGPKHKNARRCRRCENEARLGDPRWYFGAGFEESPENQAELTEPPEAEDPHEQRAHTEHLTDALHERLDQAVSEKAEEPV